jgi:hypothetical protein
VKRPSLKTASLILNGILLLALAAREGQHMLLRFQMETEAPHWAKYAGAMQAIADFGNGVRRFYRPTLGTDSTTKASYTGQLDHGAEVWSWIYYRNLGESSRLSAVAYTEAYNARMMNFIKEPESYRANGAAASEGK